MFQLWKSKCFNESEKKDVINKNYENEKIKGISYWLEKTFSKNPLYFRIYADFEADNDIDNSKIGENNWYI